MRTAAAFGGILFTCVCLLTAAPAAAQKRVALIVGNANYAHIAKLDNPLNDARLVAQTLRSLGFDLVGGGPRTDLDEAQLRQAVQEFGREATGADVALFYFAGHGVQVRGSNYLVPVGANPTREADVDFQMMDANLVLRQMENAGARLNMIILDACRNNPFGGRGLRSTASGLAQMQAPEGTLISFATQPGNVALDGVGNSPYTKAFAEAVRKPGVDIFRTFNDIGVAVSSATGGTQRPWIALSPIRGDFYFGGNPAGGNSQPPATRVEPAPVFTPPIVQPRPAPVVTPPPVVQPKPTPPVASLPPPPPPRETYRVLNNVSQGIHNMRSGPGTNFPLVVSIPAGSTGLVIGRCRSPQDGKSAHRWCEVSWRGKSGWTSSCCIVSERGGGTPR